MVSKLNRALALVRDAVVSFFALAIIAPTWAQLVHGGEGLAILLLVTLSLAFLVLSAVDVVLLARKVKWRGFFIGNAAYQLVLTFVLAGLLGIIGSVIFGLNALVLLTLRERRTESEPPISAPS
jgi:hypothetical protein